MAEEYNPQKVKANIKQENNSVDPNEIIKELQQQVQELQAEQNNNRQRINQERSQREAEAVNDIVKGFPDTFKKDYRFPFENGNDIAFSVELRAGNAIDNISIGVRASELAGGVNINTLDYFTQNFVNAIATFEVVGIDVPKRLTDLDNQYLTDIVIQVYSDYQDWLYRFRETQTQ